MREKHRREHRSPYCLPCCHPFEWRGEWSSEGERETSHECERCGYVNLRVDQRIYLSREPLLVGLENALKVAVVLFIAGLYWLIFAGFGTGQIHMMGSGWVVGLPILLAPALWQTASKLTRRVPYLRARLLWTAILGGFGALFMIVPGIVLGGFTWLAFTLVGHWRDKWLAGRIEAARAEAHGPATS